MVPEPGNASARSAQALNRYAYVLDNPLRYNDPTGHDWHRVLPHPDGWPSLIPRQWPTSVSTPPSVPFIWIDTPARLGRAYQSQGENTNDCGPTNLAMVLNWISGSEKWSKDAPLIREHLWRVPFPPTVRGATPPWSMVRAFNVIAKEKNLNWRAKRLEGSKRALLASLRRGEPVTVLLVWRTYAAHYITIVGYQRNSEGAESFYALDPDPANSNRLSSNLAIYPWNQLDASRSLRPWWAKLLLYPREMIAYEQLSVVP